MNFLLYHFKRITHKKILDASVFLSPNSGMMQRKYLKNADLLVWQGAMAVQFEKEGESTRVTMRLTPSFLIGKFKMNVISTQRFNKDKNKLKKKKKH